MVSLMWTSDFGPHQTEFISDIMRKVCLKFLKMLKKIQKTKTCHKNSQSLLNTLKDLWQQLQPHGFLVHQFLVLCRTS